MWPKMGMYNLNTTMRDVFVLFIVDISEPSILIRCYLLNTWIIQTNFTHNFLNCEEITKQIIGVWLTSNVD